MMTKWREVTSAECQRDFDDLLEVCIEIAAERITENWGLDPVAVVNSISGGRRVLGPLHRNCEGQASSSNEIRAELVDRLRAIAGDLRSYAIISDVTTEGASGRHLEVLLEHREYVMQILVPYILPDAGTLELGTTKALVAQRLLWG